MFSIENLISLERRNVHISSFTLTKPVMKKSEVKKICSFV